MKFLIFNDSKGTDNGINKIILEKLLKESCKLMPKPDCIVLGGDNIAGSKIFKNIGRINLTPAYKSRLYNYIINHPNIFFQSSHAFWKIYQIALFQFQLILSLLFLQLFEKLKLTH